MKISAFYENISEGAAARGIDMREAFGHLRQDGMDKVYIGISSLEKDEAGAIPAMLSEAGLEVEGLYGFYNLEHHPEDDSYRAMIDLAVKLHAKNVLIVPGFVPEEEGDSRDSLIRNMKAGLASAVRYGQEKNIQVSIEDFDGMTAPYNRISGVQDYLEAVPGLMMAFDTGNFVIYQEDELEAFRLFADRICTVHLKDRSRVKMGENWHGVICADGEEVFAVPVGDGCMKIREILAGLKGRGYDGGLIAEVYGCCPEEMYDGIRRSVRWIKETWETELKNGQMDKGNLGICTVTRPGLKNT